MRRDAHLLDRRWACALLALAGTIPLLWPSVPPLIDLPGHMGRYHIQAAGDEIPSLSNAFAFEWKLIGNLGVDLLMLPLGALLGVERATKLIVLAIPLLTIFGMLAVARETHGRIPATALFALPLAYAFPFQFGFLNFSLSVAFAWLMLAVWMRLGGAGRLRHRAMLFAILGCVLWLTHMAGWGLFGLSAFGVELVRRAREGERAAAIVRAAISCLPLALPVLTMLLRSESGGGQTFDWFNWKMKGFWLQSLLRDRWPLFDMASALVLAAVLLLGTLLRRLRLELLAAALLCATAFILMPRVLIGSAYADMRLLPFTAALALLSIKPAQGLAHGVVTAVAVAFLSTRLIATTISFFQYERGYARELLALDHLPRGASVLSLVVRPCATAWSTDRWDHLPAFAIVRRDAFTNDQWTADNAQGLKVIKPGVGEYGDDPSQLVYPAHCRREGSSLGRAVTEFNRRAFDHVWVIGGAAAAPDLRAVWSSGRSALYRVERIATSETPAGRGIRPTK